jgi:hypothetical protein
VKSEVTASDIYLADLLRYYEEEFEGEGLFRRLAELTSDAQIKAKMQAFVELEIHTYSAVTPLIKHYQLSPRTSAELWQGGAGEADVWADKSWLELMQIMADEFPRFCDEFVATLKITPPADQPLMQQLLDHEVAMIEFAKVELAGKPDESLAVFARHFQKYPAII